MVGTKTIVLFLASFLLLSLSSCAFDYDLDEYDSEPEFSYIEDTGRGPSKWGELDPSWQACGSGQLQSPIDLADQSVQVLSSLGQLQTAYKPTSATIRNRGHDISITWKGDAGKMSINGTQYQLERSHWHIPTEHSINGRRFDLEFHMRHTNPNGPGAVIAFLYQIGQPDPFLSKLLPSIKSVTKHKQDIGIIDAGEAGSFSGNYYRYIGSLSTPQCTEGVIWTVFQEVRNASKEQVQALMDAVDDGYEMNARPIQQVNGRPVYLYQP